MGRKNCILILMMLLFTSCCWFKKCDECFEDANLWFPELVTNVEITRTFKPTFIGQVFYPNGTIVGVNNGIYAYNEFFSVDKYVPQLGTVATFFWNRDTPPYFNNLDEGETINYYKTVVNQKQDLDFECAFQEVEEVTSILEVKVRTENGEIVGTRTVEQTVFNIPSGKYGTFKFSFDFLSCGNYEFDITIDPNGQLNETSIDDNNYSEQQQDFGFCF